MKLNVAKQPVLVVAALAALSAVPATAQAHRHATAIVPAGTTITARLEDTLSTRRSDPGDRFTATVVDPVVDGYGHVLVPDGARIRGRVTFAERGRGYDGAPMLSLNADRVSIHGDEARVHARMVNAVAERYRSGDHAQLKLHEGTPLTFSLTAPLAVRVRW